MNKIFLPHPALKSYIHCYYYTDIGTAGQWMKADMAPPGFSALIILPGRNGYQTKVNQEDRYFCQSPTFTGQITGYSDVHLFDRLQLFVVAFRPCGAYRLLGIPQQECADKSFPFSDMLGITGKYLSEEFIDTKDPNQLYLLVESFFLHQLAKLRHPEHCIRILSISEKIRQQCHLPHLIERLCREDGYSMSSLERHMKEIVGMGPKKFQRIVRFNKTMGYIRAYRDKHNWAQLACQFGYYDQVHLIREFKSFYGKTPTAMEEDNQLMDIVSKGQKLN